MTLTSFTLDDLGERLSFRALFSFIQNLPKTSALWKATHPDDIDYALWESQEIVPQLLARLSDQISQLAWMYSSAHTTKKQPKPKPLTRPGVESAKEEVYGKDPIPISQFNDWWDSH
uniref:Uncharacterized protein n=1 Tax=Siphoviridae sp. ctYkG6 TaxID=2825551 RepID=A0A8S5VCE3_9CAUD|nr:MAG TPA: protein of unknown function (DUF5361) [Siphoviridae sp. ctYkG6]DAO02421.1 MAG TPA: protein of unknown function (DUF5361) [Caudoviricetes sp.]